MADNDECKEETWSWWHFKPEQVDPYWIRCSLTIPHDTHEDSNTGLTWKKEPVENDEYLAEKNSDTVAFEKAFLEGVARESLKEATLDYTGHTSEAPFPPENSPGRFVTESHPDPENTGPFMAAKENTNYPERARALVYDFIKDHLEITDTHVTFSIDEVYTVWFCKTLQNWKGMFSTTLPDGMYYEVTYNGDKGEAYIDAYKKFKNMKVLDSTLY